MNKAFLSLMVQFEMRYPNETFGVAVSGGLDSMTLLHWMKNAGCKCVALTVDHGLRKESKAEAKFVASVCSNLKIPHKILKWTGKKPKTGIEESARTARYELMLDYCKKNNIGVLTVAHQADDQIETFLMNLGRGSGIYGLAGIREETVRDGIIIFRPLLTTLRSDLKKYCDDNKIKYTNDAMNEDEKYLRVKIRKNRHLLAEKLNISDDRLMLAIENLGRARDFIEAGASRLAQSLAGKKDFEAGLLLSEPDEIRFRALSMLLSDKYPVRMEQIKNAFRKLDIDDCKFTLAGYNIRKLENKIRIWKEVKNGKSSKSTSKSKSC